MATGNSYDGKVISVGDSVTIMGGGSVTGTGPSATVTFVSAFNDSISCASKNVLGPTPASETATSQPTGDMVGAIGNGVFCIPAVVTAISGGGNTAQLTVTLIDGTSTTVTAGACRSTSVK
jgi:hypothetical protein